MLLGGDIARNHKGIAHRLRKFRNVLAGAIAHHLLHNFLPLLFAEAELLESLIKARAGIGQFQILAVIVDVTDIRQREDGLAAIAFTTSHSGDCASGRDGSLSRIADTMTFNSAGNRLPLNHGPVPVMLIGCQRFGRGPLHIIHIVNGAFTGGEGPALFGKRDAGLHRVIAHELHHLRAEFLAFC